MADNIGRLLDTTINVKATTELRNYVSSKKDLKTLHTKLNNSSTVDVSDLKDIFNSLHEERNLKELRGEELDAALEKMLENGEKFTDVGEEVYLHEMLNGAQVFLPENPVIERSQALAARCDKLRRQQEELFYQAMTKNVSPGKFYKEDTISFQMNMMNRQLIAVGQVILSVAAGFAFGFLGIPLAIGGMEFGVRILLGLLFAIIIAIAELYFLAKHLNADDVVQDKAEELKAARPHQD